MALRNESIVMQKKRQNDRKVLIALGRDHSMTTQLHDKTFSEKRKLILAGCIGR